MANGEAAREVATSLCDAMKGVLVVAAPGATRADVVLSLVPRLSSSASDEAYELEVSTTGVTIRARSTNGLFWGVQTLRQLPLLGTRGAGRGAGGRGARDGARSARPGAGGEGRGARGPSVTLPIVSIADEPRFEWRGAMIDVGRHMLDVAEIERFIDLLALHKMNVLHWHLTDDQGWRLEIARYPKLTDVGAWRTEADGTRYGGFYTRAQVRHLVDYARARHVTIVPEIEMPGHASAALAAYPELGCTGQPNVVPSTWGVFADVYCPGREETFRFLQHVLDEVMDLFPSKVIHVGGDEVPKDHWKTCPLCQARMRAEGLKDEGELQSYFIKRVAAYLKGKGRELTGWDEILEGGVAPGATVQVWRDASHTATAIRQGSHVVASPSSHTYINRSPAELPLRTVFEFNPVPPGLSTEEGSRVRGGEATLWSENIDGANLEPMAWPRLSAFAEVLWSGPGGDYADLRRRLDEVFLPRLRAMGVNPGPEDRSLLSLEPFHDATRGESGVRVTGSVEGLEVRFTTDGTRPSAASPRLLTTTRFTPPALVQVQPFINGRPTLDRRTLQLERHLALGAVVAQATPSSAAYAGTGAWNLTDGLRGSIDFHDGLWQGWEGTDADVTIDLRDVQPVSEIEVGSLQVMRSWILLPRAVSISLSDDGKSWRLAAELGHEVPQQRDVPELHAFHAKLLPGTRARFIRVHAANAGPLPAWHPGAGGKAWIFLDEVVVR